MKSLPLTFLALVSVVAASVSGCMSVGKKFDSDKVCQIKRGVTTRADLISLFGQPNQQGFDASGSPTMSWYYMKTIVSPQTFIPVVGALAGSAHADNRSLQVTLTPSGRVKDFSSNSGTL